VGKKIFSYEEAVALLPAVQEMTSTAVSRIEQLDEEETPTEEYQQVIQKWADAVLSLGIEVKGLWLIDFDSGSGYYCWQYPEPSLQYFHGYEDGFRGRIKLN
jgi:hypothetical protein